ncbi:MAG: PAS domain S-box protein [Anaerolineae bacterium]|nr:PAS domain S-box protein [Anaerolineae bacterium]
MSEQDREAVGQYLALIRRLFDAAPICISVTDLEGRYLYANPALCQLLGYRLEEMPGMHIEQVAYPDQQEIQANRALRQKALAGDFSQYTLERRYQRKDGGVVYALLQISLLRGEDNAPLFFLAQTVDISARRVMEDALRQRLNELEAVNTLSRALRAASSEEELLSLFLQSVLSVVGGSSGVILWRQPPSRALRPLARCGVFEQLAVPALGEDLPARLFEGGDVYIGGALKDDPNFPPQLRQACGSGWRAVCFGLKSAAELLGVVLLLLPLTRPVEEAEQRLLNLVAEIGSNAVTRNRMHERLQASYQDLQREINQRRDVQAMLAREKEVLAVSLLSIREGLISIDAEQRITLFNRAAENITGWQAEQAIGKPLASVLRLLPSRASAAAADPLAYLLKWEAERQRAPLTARLPTLERSDGQKLLLSASVSPVKSREGRLLGHILIFEDATEKMRQEAQHALSQKLESIGQLAAGIAHEINTPIQYVGDNLHYLQRAFERMSEMLTEEERIIVARQGSLLTAEDVAALHALRQEKKIERYIEQVPPAIAEALEGVERVRKIVLAIREFSHPAAKEKAMADINQGILTTVTISRNEWKYHAELETDLDPNLPLVWCRIDEINQVVLNMIVNASQAIQEVLPKDGGQKGSIRIATRCKDDRVQIVIADSGAGIPEDIRSRIFDPFFTTKGVGRGTGQGLALAHSIIVQKHHGRILVDSQVGRGTTFTIELPIGSQEEGESEHANP